MVIMDHTSKAAELIRRLLESDGKDIDHDKIFAHRGASGYAPENTMPALNWPGSRRRTESNLMYS